MASWFRAGGCARGAPSSVDGPREAPRWPGQISEAATHRSGLPIGEPHGYRPGQPKISAAGAQRHTQRECPTTSAAWGLGGQVLPAVLTPPSFAHRGVSEPHRRRKRLGWVGDGVKKKKRPRGTH